jgi:hypothetical protein
LDDSDILEYSNTMDHDSDFIPASDTDNTSVVVVVGGSEEEEVVAADAPPPQSELSPLPFQELSGPKHMPPPDLILTLTVTESKGYVQQKNYQ